MGPKIQIINASDLGDVWRAKYHMRRDMRLSQWERLKEIAARRRQLLLWLSKLEDEERTIREDIEGM